MRYNFDCVNLTGFYVYCKLNDPEGTRTELFFLEDMEILDGVEIALLLNLKHAFIKNKIKSICKDGFQ